MAVVHDSYADRTGKSNTSSTSSDAVLSLNARFLRYDKKTIIDVLPTGSDLVAKLAAEVARMECILGLTSDMQVALTKARDQERDRRSGESYRPLKQDQPVPDDRKLQKLINELFTAWVFADLNSATRAEDLAALGVDAASGTRSAVVPDVDVVEHSTVSYNGRIYRIESFDSRDWSKVMLKETCDTNATPISVSAASLSLAPPLPIGLDVLIPCGELNKCRGAAVSVFQRAAHATGNNKPAATACAVGITLMATKWRLRLREALEDIQRQVVEHPKSQNVVVNVDGRPPAVIQRHVTVRVHENGRDVAVTFGSQGTLQSIHVIADYVAKLAALYRGHSPVVAVDQLSGTDFAVHMALMLLRYHNLSGAGPESDMNAGFHASIHPSFAAEIQQQFGVDTDAFANPINTTQPCFFSLFYDTDAAFGSRGSFFSAPAVVPRDEPFAMQVNPPFETNNIVRTGSTMLELLRATDAVPRTFVMVIPNWTGDKLDACIRDLQNSPECVLHKLLASQDASYVDGHQHKLRKPFFALDSKTLLMVFQNQAARDAVGVDSDAVGHERGSRVNVCIAAWAKASREALGLAVDTDWDGSRKRPL